MPNLDTVKWVIIAILVATLLGGVYHVSNLKANLAISQSNESTLKDQIETQSETITEKEREVKEIKITNKFLAKTVTAQQKEIDDLNKRFNIKANGQSRDLGAITRVKPKLINKIVNRATDNVNRCFELATGAELNEGEKNNECKELINSLTR